ncbi:hypothetical protein CRE_19724 [Caenorhabditis remanei]|uniref:F-box domain-containing protein n=1 Tax=Caenorhabditis remanei TaxID=31234 RepID=E3MTH3_CAERE|nr:hypothetical protein CRE_19724 [Caenorhabditis remanei]
MATSLSDHPIDIRALILYDNSQWKTDDESYSNYKKLCEAFGTQSVSYEDYKNWFNIYSKEAYYSKDRKRDLPILDIRGCILSDVINGKTDRKSMNNLYEAFHYLRIDMEDHDYWYNRFESGHLFTRVTFSDLPEDVIAEVVGKCELKTYYDLRNVSYGLRTIVDQRAPPYTEILLYFGKYGINISIKHKRSLCQREVFRELKILLRNPRLRLKKFQIETVIIDDPVLGIGPISLSRRDNTRFFDLLSSLDHKLQVEECSILTEIEEELVGFLQCLKPGTLQKIVIRGGQLRRDSINRIVIEDLGLSKSINFESYTMKASERLDTEAIKEALNLQQTTSPGIYSIPNSNLVVEFSWGSRVLKLSKCSV